MKSRIPRTVWILGFVSLFTDFASEMLYPVTPLFLSASLGASMSLIGLIEGAAEITAGLLKGYFGYLSDKTGKRSLFVKTGYALSAFVKPIPGFIPSTITVIFSRVTDRIGKGIRTAPRDALLASASNGNTGSIFGFHRAMDTVGAVLGPVTALVLLNIFTGDYALIYMIAVIPSLIAVIFALSVNDKTVAYTSPIQPISIKKFWRDSAAEFKWLLILLTVFSFVNSSDVFLILKTKNISGSDLSALSGYIFYNIIYASVSYPLGKLSDRFGKPQIFITGLLIFSIVYLGFGISGDVYLNFLLFGLYGIYAGATEGISKAWISDIVPDHFRGTAIGAVTTLGSFGIMAGSFFAGFLWDHFGSLVPFLFSSIISAILAAVLYYLLKKKVI